MLCKAFSFPFGLGFCTFHGGNCVCYCFQGLERIPSVKLPCQGRLMQGGSWRRGNLAGLSLIKVTPFRALWHPSFPSTGITPWLYLPRGDNKPFLDTANISGCLESSQQDLAAPSLPAWPRGCCEPFSSCPPGPLPFCFPWGEVSLL